MTIVSYNKNHEVISIDFVSPELARIVAHISGDGYVGTYNQRRGKNELKVHPRKNTIRKKYYVRYVNTETILVKQFADDIKTEFNRTLVKLRRHEYDISGKRIHSLLTALGAGKSFNWFISEKITQSQDNKVKIEWLKAFFDDEAHVSVSHKRIVLNIVNKKGLEQIQSLLLFFGIKSSLNGPYFCRNYFSYHLTIYKNSIQRYSDLIGFYHPKKVRCLQEIINPLKK